MTRAAMWHPAALWGVAITAVVALISPPSTAIAANKARPFGDATILAKVPKPGFPEGIAVKGNTVYVAGPATFGTTVLNEDASKVWAFDIDTGALVAEYEANDKPPVPSEHANSSIAFDGDGRLYVLNTTQGIYRLNVGGDGTAEEYSMPFPDLPPCVESMPSECSPTRTNAPPIPNDIAFDAAGNAYVTDSTQATIWLVPRNPNEIDAQGRPTRRPTIWFKDPLLASDYIGVNGIRLNPERTHFYITVSTDLEGHSRVYTLPATAGPPFDTDPELFHEYDEGDLPDGIAFGHSGLLYVALANPRVSGVSILAQGVDEDGRPKGKEMVRLSNPVGSASYPYDSPANIAFNRKGSILVTNHAFATGAAKSDQFSVVDVFVGDKASPLEKPSLP